MHPRLPNAMKKIMMLSSLVDMILMRRLMKMIQIFLFQICPALKMMTKRIPKGVCIHVKKSCYVALLT
ncbi:hypothetical protein KP509_14G022500 [Ceratopteris richardii]|nr:hypothetical protein KP509_14G022500 [Ceratopteris richardii]